MREIVRRAPAPRLHAETGTRRPAARPQPPRPPWVETDVLVVGAGFAGLATAAALRRQGIERFLVLEQGADVGAFWAGHYDRLQLHSPWHDLPHDGGLRAGFGIFLGRDEVLAYLQAYAKHHRLYRDIAFGQRADRIERRAGLWEVETATHRFAAPYLVVATGAQRVPHLPDLAGTASVAGRLLHSRDYRNADGFHEARVLVVGSGNSAAEIALDLCEGTAASVSMWVRGPRHAIPLGPLEEALRLARTLRLDFTEPIKRRYHAIDRRQAGFRRALERRDLLFRPLSLNLARYGIRKPAEGPMVEMFTRGRVPVYDRGAVPLIRSGRIRIVDGRRRAIGGLTRYGVRLGTHEEEFDAVVLATGYRSGLERLFPSEPGLLRFDPVIGDVVPRTNHRSRGASEPTLFFPGFDVSPIGGLGLGLWGFEVGRTIARELGAD